MNATNMRRWARYIGIAAAMTVPAVAVAQLNALRNVSFTANNLLSANDLSTMRQAIFDLETSINRLSNAAPPPIELGALQDISAVTTSRTMRASGAGFLHLVPVGGNFGTVEFNVESGGLVIARNQLGTSLTVALAAGQQFTVNVVNRPATASIGLRWVGIGGSAPPN